MQADTVQCPAEFIDCCEIPGAGRPWRQIRWEDTNSGHWYADMAMYKDLKPKCDTLMVTIKPHTVQTVTVMMRNTPESK